ncbi:MAG: cyclic nucleotide-binding domain-containing protein [Anaerolineales bacterium]|jgi:CRP-like cAMP-binding protein
MRTGELGKTYQDGENIVRQGEMGDCMYVIQEGQVEIICENNGEEVCLAIREAGEFFGEMAIFERTVRSATVRALGPARILTIDKKKFLRRIQEDPTLAFRIVEIMSSRIRELSEEVSQLKGQVQTAVGESSS